jgi:hypothetical protein
MLQQGLKFSSARASAGAYPSRGAVKYFIHAICSIDNGFFDGVAIDVVATTNNFRLFVF